MKMEGCKDIGNSDAAPAVNKDVTCLAMAVVLIALQGHTIIRIQNGRIPPHTVS